MKLLANGRPFGTTLLTKEGKPIANVKEVRFTHVAGELPELELTLCMPEVSAAHASPRWYLPGVGYISKVTMEDGTEVDLNG